MSPWCIGFLVTRITFQVGFADRKFCDCPRNTFQKAFWSALGCGLPLGSVGVTKFVPRYTTKTFPGSPTATAGK